ncbi:MAG: hypothetical protein KIS66_08215 [Fimbriimonadaceae bacterium]|nr:hypothetical protein [Fimbriimonadaceae bacterium]
MVEPLLFVLLLVAAQVVGQEPDRWELAPDGGIRTTLAKLTRGRAHRDHLEMGGRSVNAIIKWSVDAEGRIALGRLCRWPTLREKKDDTHAALSVEFASTGDPLPTVDGRPYVPGTVSTLAIHGALTWTESTGGLTVERTIFPATSLPCLLERWEIQNAAKRAIEVAIPRGAREEPLPRERFAWAAHRVRTEWIGSGLHRLAPGERIVVGLAFSAREEGQPAPYPDIESEWAARKAYRDGLEASLRLRTGDPVVDRLFAFSKLRAAENVLATRGGLMHAPGGFNRYLAALWCNDQNEYASPFFPFLGDPAGNESARNAYAWYARYANPEYRPLPSSIVAEGRGTWEGAGDRGDAAMTAYGAARWALANGDPQAAREVWPLVSWCLEYCERHRTADGVIASDSDELENRFSAGKTNLATSCLAYDALVSAAYLAEALGEPAVLAAAYRRRATDLRAAIERVFGARVAGFETYRYHEGLDRLRAWICLPLAMDILDRAAGTVDALFSPELWTKDGLLTEAGTATYWDRSTLYALRGVFRAGQADRAAEHLGRYAQRRLLGDHVPYCQEAFPESDQSHLSAESALYCRIVTEGVFGIRPVGFRAFEAAPHLPKAWPSASLTRVRAFGQAWDITVTRRAPGIEVVVKTSDGQVRYRGTKPEGKTHRVVL